MPAHPRVLRFPSMAGIADRLADPHRVGGGEGFVVYAGLFDGEPCVVVDEGTMSDFLDPDGDTDLLASLVRVEVFDDISARDLHLDSLTRRGS